MLTPQREFGAYFKTSVDDGAKNHALENNSAPLRDGKNLARHDLSKKPLAAFSHGAARRGMFGVFHLWWALGESGLSSSIDIDRDQLHLVLAERETIEPSSRASEVRTHFAAKKSCCCRDLKELFGFLSARERNTS